MNIAHADELPKAVRWLLNELRDLNELSLSSDEREFLYFYSARYKLGLIPTCRRISIRSSQEVYGKYRRQPDFVHISKPIVVEIYGHPSHFGENPQMCIDFYKFFGIKCLVVWSVEMFFDWKQRLVKRVADFVGVKLPRQIASDPIGLFAEEMEKIAEKDRMLRCRKQPDKWFSKFRLPKLCPICSTTNLGYAEKVPQGIVGAWTCPRCKWVEDFCYPPDHEWFEFWKNMKK